MGGTIVLWERGSELLVPTSPFHFDGTVFRPDHFPSRDMQWKSGTYWQTLRWKHSNYGLRLQNLGNYRNPKIKATIFAEKKTSSNTLREIANEIRWRFDLDSTGVPLFVRKFRRDNLVGSALRHHPGMRLKSGYSLYEYLVITVLLQNTIVQRSISMLQILFEKYGKQVSFDGHVLWTFWDPESIHDASEKELRSLKLGYRAKTLKRQAESFVQGTVDERELRNTKDRGTLAKALDEIYGVGSQSAWYMATEFFHFYDALDYISPWEGKIVSRIVFGRYRSLEKLRDFFAKRYGEFRGLAFSYLLIDIFWQHREMPIEWLSRLV